MRLINLDDIRDLASSLASNKDFLQQATDLYWQYFREHFDRLDEETQRVYLATLKEYSQLVQREDSESKEKTPQLKKYYRKAVKRFHPDSRGDEEKIPLFISAHEAYRTNNLTLLQTVVLMDLSENIDGLGTEDRDFLMEEHTTLRSTYRDIHTTVMETILKAARLYEMSDQWFDMEIHESIRDMMKEIKRQPLSPEGQHPPQLEGR